MEKIKNFKELRIWQKGMEMVEDAYRITRGFPKEETFGLTSQMRRASVSIPTNIAEGFKRYHAKEYQQYLYVALGSMAELETIALIATKLGLMKSDQLQGFVEKIDHVSKMTSALLIKLKQRKQDSSKKS